MRAILLLLVSSFALPAARASQEYALTLRDIYISHGSLEPAFSPNVYSYAVNLMHAHDEIAITPAIFMNQTEYQAVGEDDEYHYPVVTMHWPGHEDEPSEPTSVAIRKQIDLPDDKSSMAIEIRVANPANLRDYSAYTVSVYQADEPLTVLKEISGTDDSGNTVLVQPVTTQDSYVYFAYVHPEATSVTLHFQCATTDWLTVDGRTIDNGGSVTVARDKTRHKQMMEVTCGEGLVQQTYIRNVVQIVSDYPQQEIMRPRVVVDDNGKDCKYFPPKEEDEASFDPGFFNCPDPKSRSGKTRILGFLDPSVRYTIESPDQEVQVRVLNEIPTIPFTYRSDLLLVGTAGRYNVTWPLHFNARFAGSAMRVLGWMLSGVLMLLLVGLVFVVAFASMFGLGSPLGGSEVVNGLLFISQYFCFANFIRGSNLLSDMTEGLKWTTAFMPLPWNANTSSELMMKFQYYAQSGSHPGDISDINNAYGCLFWTAIIMGLCFLAHGGVMVKFMAFEGLNTFPHRLLFGHWETRVLHVLAFPMCTSAAMIIWSWKAKFVWKILAICAISVYSIWMISAFFLIRNAVSQKKVTWVWSSGVREDGDLEDEAGYWSDVVCDQLNTQPVNRSLFKTSFPWQWVSTVADVESVNIFPQAFDRGSSAFDDEESVMSAFTLHPQKEFRKGTSYPMGKTPKSVEVYRTRAPGVFCPGQRLIAGLLRSQWLDILFTFQGLSRFHSEVARDVEDFVVPLTVKTCQLQGPLTTGRYCFFFDGARIPVIRIFDGVFKAAFGACMGLAMASKRPIVDIISFSTAAFLAFTCLVYVLTTSPYSRRTENFIVAIVLGATGITCSGFALTALIRKVQIINDIVLWVIALTAIVVGVYSCIVTFSVFSAVACAPLEETRFLEKLANSTITIADHNEGWTVDMPAYNKYGGRDVKAQCNHVGGRKLHVSVYPSGEEPALEFDIEDVKAACRTGSMRSPVVCLYAPAPESTLQYRHANIYDKSNVGRSVAEFLAVERTTREYADQIARQIASQVEMRGRDRTVLCVTIIPPRGSSAPSGGGASSSRTASDY